MKRFKNHLIAAAVLSVLAVIGTIMNSHQAAAQQGPPGPPDGLAVRVVNPLPVPITGSTTVSGAVAATQSGTWNVGITGTPNVNVTNPATAPALSLNVNDPGRIPYQSSATSTCNSGGFPLCDFSFPAVPAGHRLVIQHASVWLELSANVPAFVEMGYSGAEGLATFFITSAAFPGFPPANAFFEAGDQAVQVYVDQLFQPTLNVQPGGSSNPQVGAASATLTGYMLDCTIAPCAKIAQ